MPKHGDGLPDAAFLPPAEVDEPLELDPAWLAERAAKQAAANQPLPKSRKNVIGLIVAIFLIIAVAIAVALLAR